MSTDPRWYELRDAVRRREYDVAERLLADRPDLLDARSGLGETVLHYLAVENVREGVAWLHARGASLNTKNKFGTPVLFEVARLRHTDLFDWFAAHGADLNAVDADGHDLVAHLNESGSLKMAALAKQRRA
jgi:ankyrin repeat protein